MATNDGSCMELALEGERLCKSGDCRSGVSYFEAAIQKGTEDLKTLSAIYSQLGNAYFYLQEYEKALEFHKHDLTLARTLGDRIGEGKASGNLGNTLKVLGKFEEAIVCCTRHLDISRELRDKVRCIPFLTCSLFVCKQNLNKDVSKNIHDFFYQNFEMLTGRLHKMCSRIRSLENDQ